MSQKTGNVIFKSMINKFAIPIRRASLKLPQKQNIHFQKVDEEVDLKLVTPSSLFTDGPCT